MQREVRYAIAQTAKADLGEETDVADLIDDFGFNNEPHIVMSCWYALRNWHVLPVEGGWLDQPMSLRDDLNTLQAIYNEEVDVLRQKILRMEDIEYVDDQTGATIKLEF